MPGNNDRTLKTYNENPRAYIDEQDPQLQEDLKQFILSALDQTSAPGRILELGSATGRDADWIEGQGYSVERTDASEAFVGYMRSRGSTARLLNALTDDLGGPYDLIYASAVLLHFTREETTKVLGKIRVALGEKGILALRMKEGDKEEWTNEKMGAPRLMVYWNRQKLGVEVKAAGFDIVSTSYSDHKGNSWIMIVARGV